MNAPYVVLTPERLLPIEGTFNFRDVGGYSTVDGRSTRWRHLFRSDALHTLGPSARDTLLDLGVRTIVDLRYPAECQVSPCTLAADGSFAYRHLPLFEDPRQQTDATIRSLDVIYRTIVDTRAERLAAIIRVLAGPGAFPAVQLITAGKDRTGVVVALVLRLLGVDGQTIASDYALSGPLLAQTHLAISVRERVIARGGDVEAADRLIASPPEDMERLLNYVDQKYGGAEGLAECAGVAREQIEALRTALLE